MECDFRFNPGRNYVLGINSKALETFGQLVPFLFAPSVQASFLAFENVELKVLS